MIDRLLMGKQVQREQEGEYSDDDKDDIRDNRFNILWFGGNRTRM